MLVEVKCRICSAFPRERSCRREMYSPELCSKPVLNLHPPVATSMLLLTASIIIYISDLHRARKKTNNSTSGH
jgi:hypothetical protein